MIYHLQRIFITIFLCGFSVCGFAVPVIGPPGIVMASSPHELGVGVVTEITHNSISLSEVDSLTGSLPLNLTVMINLDDSAWISLDDKVIFSVSRYKKTANKSAYAPRKKGPVIVALIGANPAIFKYSQKMSRYFEKLVLKQKQSTTQLMDLDGNESAHVKTFWVSEVGFDTHRLGSIEGKRKQQLIGFVLDREVEVEARNLIFNRLFLEPSFSKERPQLFEVTRKIISQSIAKGQEGKDQLLLISALKWLGDDVKLEDLDLLKAMMRNNNVSVVETSLNNLRSLGSHYENEAMIKALSENPTKNIKRLIHLRRR